MVSKETKKRWDITKRIKEEEKQKVVDFILFLMEKYDLDGIDANRLG